jgi:colanic acid biosynthesis glycosyl transferase WcaI
MTRIVTELAARGHELHVVTSLPWYRNHAIEQGWGGRLWRTEKTEWGSIIRVHPFPGKSKSNLLRRALGFIAFSYAVGIRSVHADGLPFKVDGVLAMSPPLTLGLTGWCTKIIRRAPLVFNIQDVFPDAAIQTGAISNKKIIAAAKWLERVSYQRSDAVVLLSQDLRTNIENKIDAKHHHRLHVIPNFVDTVAITPQDRMTNYRSELGIGEQLVVMYAGNVGFSQSLNLVVEAAAKFPEVAFVVNGDGAARNKLQEDCAELANVYFGDYQPIERLSEVLATGDIHLVPLRTGLAAVSVPSKSYSILAAGRPMLAAIDLNTEIPNMLQQSGAGIAVEPDNAPAFIEALGRLVNNRDQLSEMGANGRKWVETHASPASVAARYEEIFLANR